MRSTQEVLDHHIQAFAEGIDSLMMDYNENSYIISQQGSFHGIEEIRNFFVAFVESLPEGFIDKFNLTNNVVHGDIAYITWDAQPWFPFGTDTFVIKNGMINYQTFAAHASS